MIDVVGYCPMGCGRTLFLGGGGYVTCSLIGCPDPTMASRILEDPLGSAHVVTFDECGFSVTHPLRERFDDMTKCALHEHLRRLDGAPVRAGRYRANGGGDHWHFSELKEVSA